MKRIPILIAGWVALTGLLAAGVQDYQVTPSTLADWWINGADLEKLQAQDKLTLPAGGEISRRFTGGAVVLYTVSQPVFGAESVDWPVVQVGPAAVALIRKGVRGERVLLVGETVSPLPGEVPLDSNGRGLEPLELALGYDPVTQVGVVAFADQVLSFKGTANSPAVEVAVAAGEQNHWLHDSLAVLVIGPDGETDAAKGADNPDATKGAALLQSVAEGLRQAGAVIGGVTGSSADPARPRQAMTDSRLEIFTPPAVRQGARAVRDAIAQDRSK